MYFPLMNFNYSLYMYNLGIKVESIFVLTDIVVNQLGHDVNLLGSYTVS